MQQHEPSQTVLLLNERLPSKVRIYEHTQQPLFLVLPSDLVQQPSSFITMQPTYPKDYSPQTTAAKCCFQMFLKPGVQILQCARK